MARQLVAELEADDEEKVGVTLHELARETAYLDDSLFQEVGRLTRELHEAIKDFALDEAIAEIVQVDMPDAVERLNYVIDTTEGAANQTINGIEEMMDLSQRLRQEAAGLDEKWSKFRQRDLAFEDFKVLMEELSTFLQRSTEDGDNLHDTLNQILMAQGYQDLTGQIIKKVIKLVREVEGRLISLVKLAGEVRTSHNDTDLRREKMKQEDGPAVPGVTRSDVVHSQDEVDDLLSSLGF